MREGEPARQGEHRAADMRRHAAALVARVASARVPLDYSVASLRVVDFLIEGMRKGSSGDPADPAARRARTQAVLDSLGAYVGEVLVRRAGAVWVDLDDEHRAYFGRTVGVRMPDGRVWNPLGKVVNRYEAGPEESLQTFYLTLPGRHRACAAL
ncbi:hypothetical protein [Streptomyces beihaiensis]|uniref:DUF3806 domain-containing protein n=1 Tax=Streptomyces beihaiensis TaxID=2984495 RepID=A0ABT3TQG4_9ACTN|nr:hypothetical protein [Streptomyces beihaiensis]MCX3058995.1 hypothetical protein [Streptomyces beihaiensis]